MATTEYFHGVNHNYMQVNTQSQQLEQARVLWETWRSVPVLAKTLCLLQDIVKNPQKYELIKTILETKRNLACEAKENMGTPLSSLTFIYDLPPYVNGSVQHAHLQIRFSFGNPIVTALEPLALVFTYNENLENPYALIIKKGVTGTEIEARGIRTEASKKQIELMLRKIQSLPASSQPKVINCNTWSGLHGTLHPITVNHARA